MFKRMGYGFNIASSFNFLPLPLFKIIFYLASPMYINFIKEIILSYATQDTWFNVNFEEYLKLE